MADHTSEQQLDAIRAREAAATPGPWCTDGWEIYQGSEYVASAEWIGETCRAQNYDGAIADAEFIAHARTDVPELLRLLDQARRIAVGLEQQNAEAARLLRRAARAGSWETVAQAIRALHGAGLWTQEATEPALPGEDEWLACYGRRCHNVERARYARGRGWTGRGWTWWGTVRWLCPGCAAHGDRTAEQEAGRG